MLISEQSPPFSGSLLMELAKIPNILCFTACFVHVALFKGYNQIPKYFFYRQYVDDCVVRKNPIILDIIHIMSAYYLNEMSSFNITTPSATRALCLAFNKYLPTSI